MAMIQGPGKVRFLVQCVTNNQNMFPCSCEGRRGEFDVPTFPISSIPAACTCISDRCGKQHDAMAKLHEMQSDILNLPENGDVMRWQTTSCYRAPLASSTWHSWLTFSDRAVLAKISQADKCKTQTTSLVIRCHRLKLPAAKEGEMDLMCRQFPVLANRWATGLGKSMMPAPWPSFKKCKRTCWSYRTKNSARPSPTSSPRRCLWQHLHGTSSQRTKRSGTWRSLQRRRRR